MLRIETIMFMITTSDRIITLHTHIALHLMESYVILNRYQNINNSGRFLRSCRHMVENWLITIAIGMTGGL